jgi:hypothetical protein
VDCRRVIRVKLVQKVILAVPNVPVATRVKRVGVSMVLVNCVLKVNTVQVEMKMVLKRMQQLVSVVQQDIHPMKAVQNVNHVKQVLLVVMLLVKFVKIVVLVNSVQAKKTMVLLPPTQLNALVAPRVGRPKQAAQNVNRVKRVLLVLMWVKNVIIVVLANTVQAKKPMAPLPTPRNVLFVQLGTILIRGVQNVNSAVQEHTVTSLEKNAKIVHWNTPEEVMIQMVHNARDAFWVKQLRVKVQPRAVGAI